MIKKLFSFRYVLIALVTFAVVFVSRPPSDRSIHNRVVKLQGNGMSCSGEQVVAPSGVSYILTAGHCKPLATDGWMPVVLESGEIIKRRVISEDPKSDLLLIEGVPGLKGLKISEHSYKDQRVRTFTHGAGMDTYQTEGRLIQDKRIQVPMDIVKSEAEAAACVAQSKQKLVSMETFMGPVPVCILDVVETVTTAFIVGGSSGGAVVDDAGRVVGVVSAGGSGFGYLVTLGDIHAFLAGY